MVWVVGPTGNKIGRLLRRRGKVGTQDEDEDITMGGILLPGDDGFVSGIIVQTWKGNGAVENLNGEMNDDSDHGNSGKADDSTTSKDSVGVGIDDESRDSDEDSEEGSVVITMKATKKGNSCATIQKKDPHIKKTMEAKDTTGGGKRYSKR